MQSAPVLAWQRAPPRANPRPTEAVASAHRRWERSGVAGPLLPERQARLRQGHAGPDQAAAEREPRLAEEGSHDDGLGASGNSGSAGAEIRR